MAIGSDYEQNQEEEQEYADEEGSADE